MSNLSFGPGNQDEEDLFFSKMQQWETQVRDVYSRYRESGILRDENFENVTGKNISLSSMLEAIPLEERRRLLKTDPNSWSSIIKFDQTVGKFDPAKLPGFMDKLSETNVSKSYQFTINPDELAGENANIYSLIYHRLYPNLNTSDPKAGLRLSMNIPSPEYLKNLLETSKQMGTPAEGAMIGAGKKILVFDTETAGLIGGSGVRQVSAKMVETSAAPRGKIAYDVAPDTLNEYFDVARMHLGYLTDPVTGEGIPMTKALENAGADTEGRSMGVGTEFADAMRPFLQKVKEADVLVAHNASFDIDQVFGGLRSTATYKDNVNGFADLLDEAAEHILNRGTIMDTLHLSSLKLPKMQIDPILQATHGATKWSLSNLMLQSNLTELMQTELGEQNFKSMLLSGQHTADVDTTITAHLFKYIMQDKLKMRSSAISEDIRRMVYTSYAPTPITKIKDYRDVDRGLLQELIDTGGVDLYGENAARIPVPSTAGELVDLMQSKKAPLGTKFDVTPLEQEMWKTRNLEAPIAEDLSPRKILEGLGDWRRYTLQDVPYHGWLNKNATLFQRGTVPSREAFELLQERWEDKGIPFSGLSRPERWYSTAMAQAAQHDSAVNKRLGREERLLTQLGDNLGFSRFAAQQDIYMSEGEGKNISLPIDILRQAEHAEINGQKVLSSNIRQEEAEPLQMFEVSAFRDKAGKPRANLLYRFKDEEEAGRFTEWFKNLDVDDKMFEGGTKSIASYRGMYDMNELLAQLSDSGMRHGISVGFLDDKAAEYAYNMTKSFRSSVLRDADATPMRAGLSDISNGIIKTGAFIMDKFNEATRRSSYEAGLKGAEASENILRKTLSTTAGAAKAKSYYYAPEKALPIVEKSWEIYDKLRTNKWAVVGSLAAVTGMALWRRHQKKVEPGLQTVEPMPTQSTQDYYRYRKDLDLPRAPARRAPDPLLTAGVVGNLDRGKVGHTMMGSSNRYGNLYGGAI